MSAILDDLTSAFDEGCDASAANPGQPPAVDALEQILTLGAAEERSKPDPPASPPP